MKKAPVIIAIVLGIYCVSFSISFGQTGDIPTPESVLGFRVGADFEMATYEESINYFKQLAAATDRLRLIYVGRTSENRPFYLALISSAENLANVERYREISLRLAHPEGLTDDEARQLAREGKAIVHIDGAVHAQVSPCRHQVGSCPRQLGVLLGIVHGLEGLAIAPGL